MTIEGPFFFTTSILPVPRASGAAGQIEAKLPLQVRVGYFPASCLWPLPDRHGLWRAIAADGPASDPLQRLVEADGAERRAYQQWAGPFGTAQGRHPDRDLDAFSRRPYRWPVRFARYAHSDLATGVGRGETPKQDRECAGRRVYPPVARGSGKPPEFFDAAATVQAPLGLGPAWDIAGDGSLLVVELPGHHDGHVGLCFPKRAQPLLYATDVQWLMRAVLDRAPGFPAGLTEHDPKGQRGKCDKGAWLRGQGRRGGFVP